jgi:hypothetical protein
LVHARSVRRAAADRTPLPGGPGSHNGWYGEGHMASDLRVCRGLLAECYPSEQCPALRGEAQAHGRPDRDGGRLAPRSSARPLSGPHVPAPGRQEERRCRAGRRAGRCQRGHQPTHDAGQGSPRPVPHRLARGPLAWPHTLTPQCSGSDPAPRAAGPAPPGTAGGRRSVANEPLGQLARLVALGCPPRCLALGPHQAARAPEPHRVPHGATCTAIRQRARPGPSAHPMIRRAHRWRHLSAVRIV